MNEFIEEIKIIPLRHLFFVKEPVKLCRLPYPGHKKGCLNVGKNKNCPPYAMQLKDKYDLSKPHFFCYVKFNIEKQKLKIKRLHPEWTDKQCKCLLYWQNSVRKKLKNECELCVEYPQLLPGLNNIHIDYEYELIPEAMGLNVFETAAYHGIILERNPQNYVYKIAFIGVLKY